MDSQAYRLSYSCNTMFELNISPSRIGETTDPGHSCQGHIFSKVRVIPLTSNKTIATLIPIATHVKSNKMTFKNIIWACICMFRMLLSR